MAGQALIVLKPAVFGDFGFNLIPGRQQGRIFIQKDTASATAPKAATAMIQRHTCVYSGFQQGLTWTRFNNLVIDADLHGFHLKRPHAFVIHDDMKFIAFDLETTGVVPGVDQIVEIGAVRFIDGVPESIFVTLVDPRRPIPPGASAVNGITDNMVVGQPFIENLLESFADFCGDDPLIAHNAPFDMQFLTADIKRHELSGPRGVLLDTLPIARKVFPGLPNYKLTTLVQHLKIQASEFHRAQADANSCGFLFHEMLRRISTAGREPTIEQLVNLTGRPEARFPQIVRQPKQLDLLGMM